MLLDRTLLASVASVTAILLAPLSEAGVIRWTGTGKTMHWEDRENWDPKRLPGPDDDVIIPPSGYVLISKDYTLVMGVAIPEPKRVRSLTIESIDQTAIENGLGGGLRSSDSQPGAPGDLKHKAVNIFIEAANDITVGRGGSIFPGASKARTDMAVPGAGVTLVSKNGSVSVQEHGFIRSGYTFATKGANDVKQIRGPAGNLQISAKKSLSADGDLRAEGAYGQDGTGTANGGSLIIAAKEGVILGKEASGGFAQEGSGGGVSVTTQGDLVVDGSGWIFGGDSRAAKDHMGGGVALVADGELKVRSTVRAGEGPKGGSVLVIAKDLDNTSTLMGGKSNSVLENGGNVAVTTKASPPKKVGKIEGGAGRKRGRATVNGTSLTLSDPIRGGEVLVNATGAAGIPPRIDFLDGALIDAELLVCIDAEGGPVDFSDVSEASPVVAVGPAGLVNLAGEPVVTEDVPLDVLIEGTFQLSDEGCMPQSCAADLNLDGAVDELDLAFLLAFWGSDVPLVDLDGDGTVDGHDLSLLLARWGPCSAR